MAVIVDNFGHDGRSLRGNVDRNPFEIIFEWEEYSRSLRGNVDRNVK